MHVAVYVIVDNYVSTYFCMYLLSVNSKPTKKKLLEYVVPYVSSRWYILGVKLLKEDQELHLEVIKSDHAGDNQMCCMDMFSYWLSTNTDATWKQLIEALESPSVKLTVVAADIEKMSIGIVNVSARDIATYL